MNKQNDLYNQLKMGIIPSIPIRTKQICGADENYSKMYDKSRYAFLLDAPFKISNRCCDVMKKKSAKKYEKSTSRVPYIGTLAEESLLRKTKWIKFGCNAFEQKGRPTSQPLSFWTEQDILQYIKMYNLDIADVYGNVVYTDDDGMFYDNDFFIQDMKLTTTGVNRTGCTFCMFGITRDTDRFLKLKEIEPKKYDYVMRGGKFDNDGMWVPTEHILDENGNVIQVGGLGYKFIIDWLNEHGNLNIKY